MMQTLRRLRGFNAVLTTLTVLVCIFVMAPMLLSVLAGFLQNYSHGLRDGLTLRWLGEVWENYGDTLWGSIGVGLACVLTTLLLGLPCAYALARARSRWARLLEELLTLPIAVPGLASALGLILAYGSWRDFRQSYAFIWVGHVVFPLPFMVRTVCAAFARDDIAALEEAARSLGANLRQRFLGVLVPAVLPSIITGCLIVFTLSVGEFNLTWMLHTPMTRTLPVGLADSYTSLRIEIGSAYTLLFFAIILPALLGMQWLGRLIEKHHGA